MNEPGLTGFYMLQIAIVGVGAMGCLFAGYLAPRARVTMLGHWPEQISVLREGLLLMTPDGELRRARPHVQSDAAKMPASDFVLVLVKSYQSERAGREIAHFLSENSQVITLQNGLSNARALAAGSGSRSILVGSTTEGATLLGPGRVRHAGRGRTVIQQPAAEQMAGLDPFVALLRDVGFDVELTPDIHILVWRKLAVNAAINPITALLETPNGRMVGGEEATRVLEQIAAEVALVARAAGYDLSIEQATVEAVSVARATRDNRSSMLQDVQSGRPTELESIVGKVLEQASATNTPTPFLQAVYHLLKAKLEGKDWWQERIDMPPALETFLKTFEVMDD